MRAIQKKPDTKNAVSRERVEAVERSIRLLQCFQKVGEKLSLASLAQRSGFYKSTILRLAASLIYMRLFERDQDGLFALGPELRRLGELSPPHAGLEGALRPALRMLTEKTQETASFYVRRGQELVCLYRSISPRSARHHLEEGDRYPLRTGAPGKILVAFGLRSKSRAAAAIRKDGWALSLGERDPDLAAICMPVFDQQGELLGALSVSGLLTRFTPQRVALYRAALQAAIDDLAQRLPAHAPD